MGKGVKWIEKAKKWTFVGFLAAALCCIGCGKEPIDDYATNVGYDKSAKDQNNTKESKKIAKEDIKVGVLHISDPADGSGYSYTHDLGIQGMQKNLGLSSKQIVRKINIADSDEKVIESDPEITKEFSEYLSHFEQALEVEKKVLQEEKNR